MSDPTGTDPELPVDALHHIRTDGETLLRIVADHSLDIEVPSCPGWDLGDLAGHIGRVWNRWARIVAEHVTSAATMQAWTTPERPSDELLVDWVTAAHTALYSALTRASLDQEVWTWTGTNRDVAWVRRRMLHETAVHRWDAAHAAGLPADVDVAVAADGIDEFLTLFAARGVATDAAPLGGTVHLHCTDTADQPHDQSVGQSGGQSGGQPVGGEWLVTALDASGATFTREHAKGDVAIRGRASDLLLWVWGRDAGPVEIFGDTDLAESFRTYGRR